MTSEVAERPIDESWGVESDIYRSVSRLAVISFVLALFSQLAWIVPVMAIVAVVTVILAWIARRRIRRYPTELTGAGLAMAGFVLALLAAIGGPVCGYVYGNLQVPEGYEPLTFYELKPNEEDVAAGLAVSSRAKELEGKKVFIKGYVHPGVSSLEDIRAFVLVSDMKTCCFGGQPQKPWHMVEVTVVEGEGVEYSMRRRGIGGTLRLRPRPQKGPGGIRTGYYLLEADHIQ